MLSASSEFSKRIGLENNLFKFKPPKQSHNQQAEGMNECLSSPFAEEESVESHLMLDQSLVSKTGKQLDISELKKKGKNHASTQEYNGKKQGKKQGVGSSASAAVVISQSDQEQCSNTKNLYVGDEDSLFQEDFEEEEEHAKTEELPQHQNQQQRSRDSNKRNSVQSESIPNVGDENQDNNIEEEEEEEVEDDHQVVNDEEDNGEEVEDDHDEEEDDEEEDEDNDEDDENDDENEQEDDDQEEEEEDDDFDQEDQSQESATKKKGLNNINATKQPAVKNHNKSHHKHSKKTGRKGYQGRGKNNETKAQSSSASSHQGKRCHNLFCKFPYKGDLKRVKVKFTSEYVHLCQKCTERFKLKCYCLYCGQVYYDSNEGDGKIWIQCEDCQFWLHQECEKENGLGDIDALIEDDSYKFYCMRCRDKNKVVLQDKLQINILKAQMQIAKSFSQQSGGNSDQNGNGSQNASLAAATSSPTSQKQNKRQYKKQSKEKQLSTSTQKNKGKVSLASLQKQLNKPIFAPKPDQTDLSNGIKIANNSIFAHNQSIITSIPLSEVVTEPKKSKKLCNEESKTGSSLSKNHMKQSPQVHSACIENGHHHHHHHHQASSVANSSELYSATLFLKAKKQLQQNQQQQQQQQNAVSLFNSFTKEFPYPNNLHVDNYVSPYDNPHSDNHNNNANNQNTQHNVNNPYSHHQRQRKEEAMNYVELPYKKQTIKEINAKRIFYHYSVLQELLNPLSISMTLAQEQINEDLQILRSLMIGGKRLKYDESLCSHLLNHHHHGGDEISGNKANLSSQYDSSQTKQSPQQIKNTSQFLNATPIRKKGNPQDHLTQSLNTNSPIMSHH